MTEAIKTGKIPCAEKKSAAKGRRNGNAVNSHADVGSATASAGMATGAIGDSASSPAADSAKLTGKAFHEASKRVAAIERKLAKLEERKAELESQMAEHDPSDYEGLGKINGQLQAVADESESLEMEWMELSEQLE
mgnify:FL=1